MHVNRKYEKELNLRDMFFSILYRWRRILIVALGLALLFGGITYLLNRATDGSAEKRSEKVVEEYNIQKMIWEQNMERWAQGRDTTKTYLENSLYMKLDAMAVQCASRHYLIRMDAGNAENEENYLQNVMQVYGYLLEQEYDKQELQEAFGTTEMVYVREIASVVLDYNLKQVNITVMAPTEEGAQKGCDYLSVKLEALEPDAQKVAPHTLQKISEGTYSISDPGILNAQQSHISSYNEYNTNYEYTVKDYNSLEEPRTLNSFRSRAIMGFIVGLVVMVFGLMGFYMISGKLRSGREMSARYEIPVFGEMKQSRAWRKGKGLDRLIEKWEFRVDGRTDDSVWQNIASLVKAQPGVKAIALASTLKETEANAVRENLQSRLEDVSFTAAFDFLNNKDAVSTVTEADAVLVVEKKYTSENEDLGQLSDMLEVSGAKVIGAIVL